MSAVGQLNDAYYIIAFYLEPYNYLYPVDPIKIKEYDGLHSTLLRVSKNRF